MAAGKGGKVGGKTGSGQGGVGKTGGGKAEVMAPAHR